MISHLIGKISSEFSRLRDGESKFASLQDAKQLHGGVPSLASCSPSIPHGQLIASFPKQQNACGDTFSTTLEGQGGAFPNMFKAALKVINPREYALMAFFLCSVFSFQAISHTPSLKSFDVVIDRQSGVKKAAEFLSCFSAAVFPVQLITAFSSMVFIGANAVDWRRGK